MTKNVLSDLNVAFIGAGAMASAMIGGLLARHDVEPDGIIASDRHQERLDAVGGQFGVRTTLDNLAAAREAHVVVLSVKPQVLPAVLDELRGAVEPGAAGRLHRGRGDHRLDRHRPGGIGASCAPCRTPRRRSARG